jgi:hypothetical protein
MRKEKPEIIDSQKAKNQKLLHILETKFCGKVKLPKGETALSLLGRE